MADIPLSAWVNFAEIIGEGSIVNRLLFVWFRN